MSSPPEPCCGSIMAVTGSPGATLIKVKATTVMPSNIGTSSSTRRKMYWLTALRLLAALHVRVGGALRIRSLGELVRVGGGCAPPPPVAAALASSLRAPSRGDPPHDGPSADANVPATRQGADRKRWHCATGLRAACRRRKAARWLARSPLAKPQPSACARAFPTA